MQNALGALLSSSIPENIDLPFIEHVLRQLPSNIFLKDNQARYVFATKYWDHIRHEGEGWSIKGKTDFDIRRNRENAQKAYDQDMQIIETGIGTSYIIEETVDGKQEFLEIIKNPVCDEDGKIIGIVGLINNVTEKEQMRLKLERLAVTDPMTGLLNRHHFGKFVDGGLEPEQCPAMVVIADCDKLKYINDTYGHACGNEFIRQTADWLRRSLPENALIFRTGGDEFAAIIPNADQEASEGVFESLQKNKQSFEIEGCRVTVSSGCFNVLQPHSGLKDAFSLADFMMYENKRSLA